MKTNWQHQTHRRALIVLDQLQAAIACAPGAAERDAYLSLPDNPHLSLLDQLYSEDYPLARLLDTSDLLIQAEGPGLRDNLPWLRAAAWLCDVADKQLRHLVLATMDLAENIKHGLAKHINLRLTGLAPGSLYAGFKLMPAEDDLLSGAEDPAFALALSALQTLPQVPQFIGDEILSAEITEAIPDPALRDASLVTAFRLSPTGHMGIHTLGLGVPGRSSAILGQRERVVLREALRRPPLADGQRGRFIGEIREFDLDKTRFHLRGIPRVGTLRCVFPDPPEREEAKALLGESVAVTGRYAADATGKPRLMLVDTVEVLQAPDQAAIPLSG